LLQENEKARKVYLELLLCHPLNAVGYPLVGSSQHLVIQIHQGHLVARTGSNLHHIIPGESLAVFVK
jgi:hypothetical protein